MSFIVGTVPCRRGSLTVLADGYVGVELRSSESEPYLDPRHARALAALLGVAALEVERERAVLAEITASAKTGGTR